MPSGPERHAVIMLSLNTLFYQINQPTEEYSVELELKNVHYETKFTVFVELCFLVLHLSKNPEVKIANILKDKKEKGLLPDKSIVTSQQLHTAWNSPISKFYIRSTFVSGNLTGVSKISNACR